MFRRLKDAANQNKNSAHTVGEYNVRRAALSMYSLCESNPVEGTAEMFELLPLLMRAQAAGILVLSPRWFEAGADPEMVAHYHMGHLVADNLPITDAHRTHPARIVVLPVVAKVGSSESPHHVWAMFVVDCTRTTVVTKSAERVFVIAPRCIGGVGNKKVTDVMCEQALVQIQTQQLENVFNVLLPNGGAMGDDVEAEMVLLDCEKATEPKCSAQLLIGAIHTMVMKSLANQPFNYKTLYGPSSPAYTSAVNIGEELCRLTSHPTSPLATRSAVAVGRNLGTDDDETTMSDAERLGLHTLAPPGRMLHQSNDAVSPKYSTDELSRGATLLTMYALETSMEGAVWAPVRTPEEVTFEFVQTSNELLVNFCNFVRKPLARFVQTYNFQENRSDVETRQLYNMVYSSCINEFVATEINNVYVRHPENVYLLLKAHLEQAATKTYMLQQLFCRLICDNNVEFMSVSFRCFDSSARTITHRSSVSLARMWRAYLHAVEQGWFDEAHAASSTYSQRVAHASPSNFIIWIGDSQAPEYWADVVLDDVVPVEEHLLPPVAYQSCTSTPGICLHHRATTQLFAFPHKILLYELVSFVARLYYRPRTPSSDSEATYRQPAPLYADADVPEAEMMWTASCLPQDLLSSPLSPSLSPPCGADPVECRASSLSPPLQTL